MNTETKNHMARRSGFHVTGVAWCEYKLQASDKFYLTVRQVRQAGNACETCVTRYENAARRPTNYDGGAPKGGQNGR